MWSIIGAFGAVLLACGIGSLVWPKADMGNVFMITVGAALLGAAISK